MERTGSGNSFVRLSTLKRITDGNIRLETLRSEEVSVDLGIPEPGNWHRRAALSDEEAHAMLELNFDVNRDHVTLRSVNSGAVAEVEGEEQMWEHRHSRNGAISAILARSGSNTTHSTSVREGIKTVGNMVKQFSSEIMRASGSASSRVQDKGQFSVPLAATHIDPELGQGTQMQKSASTAERAIQGMKEISEATATADQRKSWVQVEARFQKLATPEGLLLRSHFAECIGMKDSKEFANELYDAATRRRKAGGNLDSITKEELYDYYMRITDKSFDARMQTFLDLCDKDLDGRISEDEVKQVIMLSASANKLSKLKEQAAEYAALIMEELDTDRDGYIELSQLETLMSGPAQGYGKEAVVQYTTMLTRTPSMKNKAERFAEKTVHFFQDNWKQMWMLTLWFLAMAGLFTWKFIQYKHHDAFHVMGYCLCVAKGAAETLKLNMALILLPVCRNTLTWLRSTRLGRIIPFDNSLEFHKIIAGAIAVEVFIHGAVHITCDIPRFVNAPHEEFEEWFGEEFDHQPSYGEILRMPVGLTAIVMVVLMVIAMLLATHWFRRSVVKLPWPLHKLHGFNVFWYSHHLFVIVYCLLIVHSIMLLLYSPWYERSTWMYIAVPLVIYISERFLRVYRTRMQVDVVKAAVYTGNVLAIHMTKPAGFKYKSGMYLFLQCPEISSFEWHPFSITSAPDDPFLSVHIRTLGDWTAEMKRIFSKAIGGRERLQTVNDYNLSGELTLAARFPKLYVDGPYGAPAQDYLKYDVLLLVGLGIGATPFISILKDMLQHSRNDSVTVCDESANPDLQPDESPSMTPKSKKKPKRKPKAYYYWVTREQGSFDWFRGIMREVEEIDNKQSIEMHNYLTSVYEEGDARSNLVMMLQALHHAKKGVDLVSGTRARTHFARPNWKSVFSKLAATHQDKRIGVFYCGPVALAKELEALSRTYTMKSTTKFSFHKENF
ncbi:hypothetical protein M758_3G233800 [Ceratodon purpureus]|nr:hypothetical protein M758_3G233800 [Ceratodon purpureus]